MQWHFDRGEMLESNICAEKSWRRGGEHNKQHGDSAAATSPVFDNSNGTRVPRPAGPAVPSRLPCRPPVTWAGPVPQPVPGSGPAKISIPAAGGLRQIWLHKKDQKRIRHVWVFLLQVSSLQLNNTWCVDNITRKLLTLSVFEYCEAFSVLGRDMRWQSWRLIWWHPCGPIFPTHNLTNMLKLLISRPYCWRTCPIVHWIPTYIC